MDILSDLSSTNLLKAQQNLIEELTDIYNNAPIGYHSLDTEGVILRMNDTALRWFGYTREEVEGKMHLTQLLPEGKTRDGFAVNFPILKATGHAEDKLIPMLRKDGSVFPILFSSTVVNDEKGNYLLNHASMWDMTEKVKLEDELKRTAEALYEANQEKNRFIGVASHDLQNPITAIAMSAELLEKATAQPTPMQQKLIKSIRSAADRMTYIVTNILNINRIERGMISDDWRDINLKTMIWDVVNRYQLFATRKNIEILQIVNEQENWNMRTEPNYLIQAVENLLSNAIKFSHRDKKIKILLQKDYVRNEYRITIQDEGQGIKEEDMPLLFGKFQKLSARPTAGETSTGLGLSVAKEFIEILRGSIECQSEWGVGTSFTVCLPISNADV